MHAHSVSPHQHGVSVRILFHRLLQAFRQVLLEWCILDYGHPQRVVKTKHSLPRSFRYALDLFDIADLETCISAMDLFHKESHKYTPLGMSVDAATGPSFESSQEEWRTSRRLQSMRLADVLPCGWWILGGWVRKDKHIIGFNELFLHARRSNVDMFVFPNACPASSPSYPSFNGVSSVTELATYHILPRL